MSDTTVTIKVPCVASWKLLSEYDNSNNHNTTFKRTVQVTQSKSITGKDYTKHVDQKSREEAQKAGAKVTASATWGPASASVEGSFESSKMLKDFVSSTTEVTQETQSHWEKTETQDYTIGPGDQLYFYQQTFTGPGVDFTLDVYSVMSKKMTPADDVAVNIIVTAKPVEFIQDLKVVYGDNEGSAPNDRVREHSYRSDDINHGMGGKYVWLVPIYTLETPKASSEFEIRFQGSAIPGKGDLAKGAGGDYRYLFAIQDQRQPAKIVEVKLLRSGSAVNSNAIPALLGQGWTGARRDINQGRKGDYLYLVWRTY